MALAFATERIVFNDARLQAQYGGRPMPTASFYEAYFEGALDVRGDLLELLRQRHGFLKHGITRQHLEWAVQSQAARRQHTTAHFEADAIQRLYDELGSGFFRAFLGESMAFTCGHFESPSDSLEQAQARNSERVCAKLALDSGQRLLDVGCGWGTLLEHAVAQHRVIGTGVTVSAAQAEHARRRLELPGAELPGAELPGAELPAVESSARILQLNYEDLPAEQFERIVCIEAVEQVGKQNLKRFFERLASALTDDGRFLLQWTGLRHVPRPEDVMWGLFVGRYIFPGAETGLSLSTMLTLLEESGWEVCEVDNASQRYVHTLSHWRNNWQAARAQIVSTHGERRHRIWHFFLAWSELVGEQGGAACHQVLLQKSSHRRPRRLFESGKLPAEQ